MSLLRRSVEMKVDTFTSPFARKNKVLKNQDFFI